VQALLQVQVQVLLLLQQVQMQVQVLLLLQQVQQAGLAAAPAGTPQWPPPLGSQTPGWAAAAHPGCAPGCW
jgi:hypothetical protein